MEVAIKQLSALGAVSVAGKALELTEVGRHMAKFPLDPKYSKMLMMAPSFGCLEEVRIHMSAAKDVCLYHSSFYSFVSIDVDGSVAAVRRGHIY